MAYLEVFNRIVGQKEVAKARIKSNGIERDVRVSCYLTWASNIVLVLEGGRLAYRYERDLINVDLITMLDHNLGLAVLPLSPKEPLITVNEDLVLEIIKSAQSDEAMGKILGYAYIGGDWMDGDRYMIGYKVKYQEAEEPLYAFMVPIVKYNDEIRCVILTDLERFRVILGKYDVKVEIECFVMTSNGLSDVVELP